MSISEKLSPHYMNECPKDVQLGEKIGCRGRDDGAKQVFITDTLSIVVMETTEVLVQVQVYTPGVMEQRDFLDRNGIFPRSRLRGGISR